MLLYYINCMFYVCRTLDMYILWVVSFSSVCLCIVNCSDCYRGFTNLRISHPFSAVLLSFLLCICLWNELFYAQIQSNHIISRFFLVPDCTEISPMVLNKKRSPLLERLDGEHTVHQVQSRWIPIGCQYFVRRITACKRPLKQLLDSISAASKCRH